MREHECPTCGEGFGGRVGVGIHHSKAHGESLLEYERRQNGEGCPTCGEYFDSEHGVEIHHKQAHDEYLGRVKIECEWCGNPFEVKPSDAERRSCCSSRCQEALYSDRWTGEGNPQWGGGKIEVSCEVCGTIVERRPSKLERSEFVLCSKSCKSTWNANRTGDDAPRWEGGKVEVCCEVCGKELQRWPYQLKISDKFYCIEDDCAPPEFNIDCPTCDQLFETEFGMRVHHSRAHEPLWTEMECAYCNTPVQRPPAYAEKVSQTFCTDTDCMSNWLSEQTGEHARAWKGGHPQFYGPNWRAQRQKALERDGHQCQSCGLHADGHWRDLSVHHITKVRKFRREGGEIDYASANALDNLVTLCDACHPKWEAMSPLRPVAAE